MPKKVVKKKKVKKEKPKQLSFHISKGAYEKIIYAEPTGQSYTLHDGQRWLYNEEAFPIEDLMDKIDNFRRQGFLVNEV
jgi:hypothetical protein